MHNDFKANTTNIQKRNWTLKRQKSKVGAGGQGAGDKGWATEDQLSPLLPLTPGLPTPCPRAGAPALPFSLPTSLAGPGLLF